MPLIDPGHNDKRAFLRLLGPIILGIGVVFTAIGLGSFFLAFGTFSPPRYFWCAFIGMPLIGIGVGISKVAFMGAIGRYIANETAPVGKDVANYMADGTKDAIRDVASAVGEGFSASRPGQQVPVVRCHKCNETNDASANFCGKCGASLGKSEACAECGELNDPDARYCDNCGREVRRL